MKTAGNYAKRQIACNNARYASRPVRGNWFLPANPAPRPIIVRKLQLAGSLIIVSVFSHGNVPSPRRGGAIQRGTKTNFRGQRIVKQ
jgi:hypothetical protein